MSVIKVYAYCKDCEDLTDKPTEMKGAETCLENTVAKTQSREYECPECGKVITILLDFSGVVSQ